MSHQQSAMCNCSRKGCRNPLPPNDSNKMCIKHQEKAKQYMKKVQESLKYTQDDIEFSDASLRFIGPPLKISMCRGLLECARGIQQMAHLCGNAQWYISCSPYASFKAYSPQLDTLHLSMSIWLVYSTSSSHTSRPLAWLDGLSMDVLRKTVILTLMKKNILTVCPTIPIWWLVIVGGESDLSLLLQYHFVDSLLFVKDARLG